SSSALRSTPPTSGASMRVTLPTAPLLDAVGLACAVAASKSPKRILECVALRASKPGRVTVAANDLDVSISIDTDGSVEAEGTVAVSATRLLSVLREAAEGRKELTLVGEEGHLDVDTPDCHFRI